MEQIKLNKENPKVEFKFNSEDSKILIQSIYITFQNYSENGWSNFISKINLSAELEYVVFDDQRERLIDERRKKIEIHLLTHTYQVQQVFQLNKLLKNETFTLGVNPELKFYRTLKLELQEVENINEDYTIEFNIEKFKVDD